MCTGSQSGGCGTERPLAFMAAAWRACTAIFLVVVCTGATAPGAAGSVPVSGSADNRSEIIDLALDPAPALPPAPGSFDDLPGNRACVSCNAAGALLIAALELALVSAVTGAVAKLLSSSPTARAAGARHAAPQPA